MVNATGRTRPHLSAQAASVDKLARWIANHLAILQGLAQMREGGDRACDAVNAVLALPEINALRCGWELWELLVAEDGDDARALLLENLPVPMLELAERALWGRRHRPGLAVLAEGEAL